MMTVCKVNASTRLCYLSMARLSFAFFICLFFVVTAECVTPVSNAGPDRAVEPGSTVYLDGTGSTQGLVYSWTHVNSTDSGEVELEGADTLTPSFKTLADNGDKVYRFVLVVFLFEDGKLSKSFSDSVDISVRSPLTFKVPSDYPTIASALQLARNIDTVILESGEYSESSLIVGGGVRVIGAGPEKTIISGKESGPVFTFARYSGTISEISSLTIKNGRAVRGAAVLCDEGSQVRISNVNFTDNKLIDGLHAGAGGGVYVSKAAKAIVKECHFVGNSTGFDAGSAVFVAAGGGADINNNWFIDNEGAAVAIDGARDDRVNITNNIFWGNKGSYSDAVFLDNQADAAIVNNTFFENGSLTHGDEDGSGTIRLLNSSKAEIVNNIFSNNRNKTSVFFDEASTVGIFYNDFWMSGKGTVDFVKSAESLKKLEENEEIASHNMFVNPVLVGPYPYKDFFLASFPLSPCKDAGDKGIDYNDIDGTRNDMGFSGGPLFYMPKPEKEALDALRRFYVEFGKHVEGGDTDALGALFSVEDVVDDDEMIIIDLASSEWEKSRLPLEELFNNSHLLLYLADPTNITLSPDGKTAWVSENVQIRQFKKDSFSYGENVTWLKRERFVLSSEGQWLRRGDGSSIIPNWSLKLVRTAKDNFYNYSLQADFEPKDIDGNIIPREDIKEAVLILPNGQEKVFSADINGVFHVFENTFSPMNGLYTLRVIDNNHNKSLTSRRISSTGVMPMFSEIPNVKIMPASGSSIEWKRLDGSKSYTVEIRRAGRDAFTFYVEDSDSFGDTVSFFPVLPGGAMFALKSNDWVRVIAKSTTSDEQQVASASEVFLITNPETISANSAEFHVVDEDGNHIRAARINFLNGGLVEDSATGDFSYELNKDKEYVVRFSADLYYPEVFTVRADIENFSKTVVLERLPKNITSVIVPTMHDAARAILFFMLAVCFFVKTCYAKEEKKNSFLPFLKKR